MELPKTERQWTYSLNNIYPTATFKTMTFYLYTALVEWGASPVACSWWDADEGEFKISTAGDGGKNGKFENAAEMVWRVGSTIPGEKSWGVLQLPFGIGQLTFQMYMNNTNVSQMQMYWSRAGYDIATGTITNRPVTLGTEIGLRPDTSSSVGSNTLLYGGSGSVWHTAKSIDGKNFRWFCSGHSSGLYATLFSIEQIADPAAKLTAADQYVIGFFPSLKDSAGDGTQRAYREACVFGYSSEVSAHIGLRPIAYVHDNDRMLTSLTTARAAPQTIDTGAYPIGEDIILWSSTAGAIGRFGRMVDLWWGNVNVGAWQTLPSDGGKTHVHLGNVLLHPWDGNTTCFTRNTGGTVMKGDWDKPTKVYGTASTPTTSIVRQNPLLVRGKP